MVARLTEADECFISHPAVLSTSLRCSDLLINKDIKIKIVSFVVVLRCEKLIGDIEIIIGTTDARVACSSVFTRPFSN